MTSTQKPHQKKPKPTSSPQSNPITQQLKLIIKSLNNFLKQYFDQSLTSQFEYIDSVKQYFVQQSTNSNYSCLISSMLSKISNMLQPFLQNRNNYKLEIQQDQYKLKQEIGIMKHKIDKQRRKIKELKEEINMYKDKSTKLTNFIYMLRINNIDIDSLYEKSMQLFHKKDREKDQMNSQKQFQYSQQSQTELLRRNQISNFQTR